jgi:Domain of unknown function (DUF4194)
MTKPYSSLIIKLLQKEAIYDDDKYWSVLIEYEKPVRDYFGVLGLELIMNRSDGFARLSQKDFSEDEPNIPLRLIRTIKMDYDQSLMCIVLREWIDEFEGNTQQMSSRLFITREELKDRVGQFFPRQNNRKKLLENLDKLVEKMKDYGFLKVNRKDENNPDNTQYEVKTLIKSKIDNEQLEEFKNKLQNYAESI